MLRRNRNFNENKIDMNHNMWRIQNDLKWLLKDNDDFSILYSLYWFDNGMKNICFPWVLKIERQLKSVFIYFYKEKYNTDDINEVLIETNYIVKKKEIDKSNLIRKRISEIIEENKIKKIDQLLFSLTFGETVNFMIYFNNSIIHKMANHFRLEFSIFVNVIKYLNIIRNAIAHNKTIIKIVDEKNNKKFSLKKQFFDFEISKVEIDIISSKITGIIFTIKQLLIKSDRDKVDYFIKDVKKQLKIFKKHINSKHLYNSILNKLFLNYKEEILSW